MVDVRPFRGLRYDPARAGEPARLLSPPYDVIDPAQRAELAARSEHNCVHVILPEGEGAARYAHGAARFRELVARALVRDPRPAFYVYHQGFVLEERRISRRGFVGLVELTPFGAGPVLGHERTLSGPKQDRLDLMRACDAHLELVFGLFSDPDGAWERALGPLDPPVLACEFDGVEHALFVVDDPDRCAALRGVLADRRVYIADGHHRYETMCTFARELAAAGRGEAARFGMIYLSNLDDEGLVVLPTHRLVAGLAAFDPAVLLTDAAAFFEVRDEPLPGSAAALSERLGRAGAGRAAFGLAAPGSGRLAVLTVRADLSPAAAGLSALAPALRGLDVVLLHELVLERGLGIDKPAQARQEHLRYLKSTAAALEVARTGDGTTQLVCFLNPPRVRDVAAVCDSGEVMPQKSTFFYPKIPTGLAFHDLSGA